MQKYHGFLFTDKAGNIIRDTNDPDMETDTYDDNIENTGVDNKQIISTEKL